MHECPKEEPDRVQVRIRRLDQLTRGEQVNGMVLAAEAQGYPSQHRRPRREAIAPGGQDQQVNRVARATTRRLFAIPAFNTAMVAKAAASLASGRLSNASASRRLSTVRSRCHLASRSVGESARNSWLAHVIASRWRPRMVQNVK